MRTKIAKLDACYVVETSDSMLMVYVARCIDSIDSNGRWNDLLLASSASALTLGVDFGGERTGCF